MGKRGPLVNFKIMREATYKWIEGRDFFDLGDINIQEIFELYKELLLDTMENPKLKAGTHNKFKIIQDRGLVALRKQISAIINHTNNYTKYKNGKEVTRFELIN
tara:strand:+ start:524 stop:835 length:312 start_codon:yes stop_codon:yes gene_type:complete